MKCPECNSDWDGGDILEVLTNLRDTGRGYVDWPDEKLLETVESSYGYTKDNPKHYSRLIGIYNRLLDRTTAWQCPDCQHVFTRRPEGA